MSGNATREPEARLLRPAGPERFGPAELDGLPEPVRRHLTQAIAPGTPPHTSARLTMRGQIKVGRWLPFRARQVLSGTDRYVDGAGALRWRLAGLITVAAGDGPDVARSAAGRAGAEGIWLPTALLPRFGVRWTATADDRVTADLAVGETPVTLELRLDPAGRIVSLAFDRWGDPGATGSFGWHRFGGRITGYASFGGLTIPAEGRLGWDGDEFFRYRITGLEPSR